MIECRTYRWLGHHVRDTEVQYRPEEEIETWKKRCPVEACKQRLLRAEVLTPNDLNQIDQEVKAKIDKAEEFARDSPYPTPEAASKYVYAPQAREMVLQDTNNTRRIKYSEAVCEALREEMRRDDRVFVLGEDIGFYGGIFMATKGLIDEFGPERVRDTPISETAIIGATIGSALTGMRPVAEIMYMDFLNLCMDQLLNHAPKIRYMTAGQLKLPMVIRTQYSLGRLLGAQHSQFFPASLMQFPGLKIALPSTPYDAKGLLKTAIRDDNPVLFVECGQLYMHSGPVPEKEYTLRFGEIDIKRKGDDATVIALSNMVPKALTAAIKLQDEGVDVEVIDPRTLVPLDRQGIIKSVKKTGRLIVAEESCKTCGVGAEISALIVEEAFDYLDAPVLRVAAPDMPAPFSPPLNEAYIPNENSVIEAVKKIMR